jgi:hypothetical protein
VLKGSNGGSRGRRFSYMIEGIKVYPPVVSKPKEGVAE